MPITEWMLGFGRVVASALDDASNAITWSIEYLTGDESSTREPLYGPLGTYARPRPPVAEEEATLANPAGETEVLTWRQEDRTYIIASKDLRLSAKVNPIVGEVGLVGYDGGFISIRPNTDENGSTITLYAPRNVDPPKAHTLQMVTTDGNSQVSIVHESGQSVVLNPQGEVTIMGSTEGGPSDGSVWISVGQANGIVLSAANIGCAGFTMLGDKDPNAPGAEFVALALKVLTELQTIQTIFNSHTHVAPAGGGATGAPTTLLPAPSPVAATKAKAI